MYRFQLTIVWLTAVSVACSQEKKDAERPKNSQQAQILDLRAAYMIVQKQDKYQFAPGTYDPEKRIFHVWRESVVDDIPGYSNLRRPPILDPDNFFKFTVVSFEPPIKYIALEGNKFAPGHHMESLATFFRWKGVVLEKNELPEAVAKKMADHVVERAPIVGPRASLIWEVTPPKYLLDKPELWKKTAKDMP
jgi:hypothetical protein